MCAGDCAMSQALLKVAVKDPLCPEEGSSVASRHGELPAALGEN